MQSVIMTSVFWCT